MTEETALTDYRLNMIEKTLASISDSLRQLTVMEQKYLESRAALERAFAAIEKQDKRLDAIEAELPTLKLTRGWVIAATIGTMGVVGMALIKLVVSQG